MKKTIAICGPASSAGVQRCVETVKKLGGNPVIVAGLNELSSIQNVDSQIIFRKKVMEFNTFENPRDIPTALVYANKNTQEQFGPGDQQALPNVSLLYLTPTENVTLWIEEQLNSGAFLGEEEDDEFSWGESEGDHLSIGPVKTKPKTFQAATYSPLGGAGKTTSACIIAKLAEESGLKVCVVESDNDNAGVLQFLGKEGVIEGLSSILEEEWVNYELFDQKIRKYVQKAGSITVIPIGVDNYGLRCTQESIGTLYEWVKNQGFDFVIYDLPPQLDDLAVYMTLQEVDNVILLAEPTIKAEEKLIRFVERIRGLRDLKSCEPKIRLVINKYIEGVGVTAKDIINSTRMELLGTIPAELEKYYKMMNYHKLVISKDSAWRTVFNNMGIGRVGFEQKEKKSLFSLFKKKKR